MLAFFQGWGDWFLSTRGWSKKTPPGVLRPNIRSNSVSSRHRRRSRPRAPCSRSSRWRSRWQAWQRLIRFVESSASSSIRTADAPAVSTGTMWCTSVATRIRPRSAQSRHSPQSREITAARTSCHRAELRSFLYRSRGVMAAVCCGSVYI